MNGCFGKPSYILLLDNNIQKRGLSALSALETSISLFLFLSSVRKFEAAPDGFPAFSEMINRAGTHHIGARLL